MLCGEDGILVDLNTGILPDSIREGALFLLNLRIGLARLIECDNGLLELFCVLRWPGFLYMLEFLPFLLLALYFNILVLFFRIHPG